MLEEWRLGRGAGERIRRKQLPLILRGSRYADRLPIGRPEILQKGRSSRLRDFYRDWYTPGRMAVIAVGDVEPARMDSLIHLHFADLTARPKAPPTPVFEVPPHQETLVSIATDKEATRSQLAVYFKHPHRGPRTIADFRRGLADELFSTMLNARLDEIAHRGDSPFLNAGAFAFQLGKTLDVFGFTADAHSLNAASTSLLWYLTAEPTPD